MVSQVDWTAKKWVGYVGKEPEKVATRSIGRRVQNIIKYTYVIGTCVQ